MGGANHACCTDGSTIAAARFDGDGSSTSTDGF
jgi:hypothetical protein